MTLAPSPDNIILGKGELLFDRFDANGVAQGYRHLGNCSGFKITPTDDRITMNTSMSHTAGIYKQVTRRRELTIEITAHEHSIANMALLLMGDESTLTQSAQTVTEALTTSVKTGYYYRTSGRNISGVTISQGTVAWVLGTDYTVKDATGGLIYVKESASTAVTTATTATITYTQATASLQTILAGTKGKIEGKLLFIPDPTTGPQYDVECYWVSVFPSGDLNLVGEDFGEFTLSMSCLDDSAGAYGGSASNPYFRLINRGQA